MIAGDPTEFQMQHMQVFETTPAAREIQLFEFRAADESDLPPFEPGAHLMVRAPNGLLRRYSLCSDPHERDHYQIAVKREAQGRGGSISMIEECKVGNDMEVSLPRNDFALVPTPVSYLFIAGGIGITPILSMIRYLRTAGGKPYKLFYLTREPLITAFRDELTASEYRGKVVIHHDYGDPDKSFDLWPLLEQPKGAHLYCCGPRGLMEAVRDMTGHWSTSAVHFEDFGSGKAARGANDNPFTVRLAKSGLSLEVPVGKSLLEVLRASGHEVPYSCESGTCGTCRVQYLEGEVDHRDLVLTEQERVKTMMVCVSRAFSPELVLDL